MAGNLKGRAPCSGQSQQAGKPFPLRLVPTQHASLCWGWPRGAAMAGERAAELGAFAALHGPALRASGVPVRYWDSLRRKLEGEVRPAGSGPASRCSFPRGLQSYEAVCFVQTGWCLGWGDTSLLQALPLSPFASQQAGLGFREGAASLWGLWQGCLGFGAMSRGRCARWQGACLGRKSRHPSCTGPTVWCLSSCCREALAV